MNRPLTPLAPIVLCGAGLRLLAVPPRLPATDHAHLLAALAAFDPLHAAGSPLSVALAQLFAALGSPDRWALLLPGLLGFVVAMPLFFRGVEKAYGRAIALLLTGIVAVLPGAVAAGARPEPEGLDLALLLAALGAALLVPAAPATRTFTAPSSTPLFRSTAARWALTAGLLAGLGLGAHLLWWPLFLGVALLAAKRRPLVAVAAFLAGVAVWAVPTALLSGFEPAALGGIRGGTDPASYAARLAQLVRAIASGFGGVVAMGAAVLVLATDARRRTVDRAPQVTKTVLVTAGAYALWVFAAQSGVQPRHALPLALVLAGTFVVSAYRRAGPRAAFVIFVVLAGMSAAAPHT